VTDFLPFLLALVAAFTVDWASERRGLLPSGFRLDGEGPGGTLVGAAVRRGLAFLSLTAIFWLGVFSPLAEIGSESALDLTGVPTWQLFLMHAILLWGIVFWLGMGHAGVRTAGSGSPARALDPLGLRAAEPGRELAVGLAGGLIAWAMVIVAVLALTGLIWALGAEDLLPTTPPDFVLWVVSLPVVVRLGLSLSAGVVEELFFRGFLQPRIGLGLSSLFFVVAHINYGQPLMLVGVALLSLFFGWLTVWRKSIWAAVVAHFVFDAIQLLIVIPTTLEWVPEEGAVALARLVLPL
jgi:membrane protease YdiL (CAAX protease family)